MKPVLAMAAMVAFGTPIALADPSAGAPAATTVTAHAAPSPTITRHGLAVGVALGDPSSATVAWFAGKLVVDGALGTGTFAGPGVSAHAELAVEVHRLAAKLPVRVGLGGRFYHQNYQPMSISEIPDNHYGLRASASLAFERGPFEVYAELAPGLDLKRTQSCTLRDGPYSICPHAQSSPVFLEFAVGVRWFLSH